MSYQDQLEEMKHNFRFLYRSLNHDENVLNEYITPLKKIKYLIFLLKDSLTSGNSITRQYLIPFLNLILKSKNFK